MGQGAAEDHQLCKESQYHSCSLAFSLSLRGKNCWLSHFITSKSLETKDKLLFWLVLLSDDFSHSIKKGHVILHRLPGPRSHQPQSTELMVMVVDHPASEQGMLEAVIQKAIYSRLGMGVGIHQYLEGHKAKSIIPLGGADSQNVQMESCKERKAAPATHTSLLTISFERLTLSQRTFQPI